MDERLIDEERLLDRLVGLVRIPSITGSEDACIHTIAEWLREVGAEVECWQEGITAIQRDPRYPGHEVERAWLPVAVGVIRGARPGPSILLTGHVDVVPPGNYDLWEHEPFAGLVNGDRVYGCGASDMKSGLAAALEAFQAFATGRRDFSGRLIFAAVPAEEDSGLGTLAAIRRDWCADAAIIPEPTTQGGVPELIIAHAGAMSFNIKVPGRTAHASKRLWGRSALDHFLLLYEAIRRDEATINGAETHPLMKSLDLPYASNVGKIQGGLWSSSVMESLDVEVRVGIALGETVDEAEARFRRAIDETVQSDPWLRENPPVITRRATGFGAAATPEDHPLVQAMASASASVFRQPARITAAPYGCDMAGWIRHARTPTVAYGPGDIEMAHAANESVSLETTAKTSRVLVRAIEELLALDVARLRELNHSLYAPLKN